jgi:hypothetical protein
MTLPASAATKKAEVLAFPVLIIPALRMGLESIVF